MKKTIAVENGPAPQGEPFGEYVSKVRCFRGLSKTALAKSARVAYSTIARIENGQTSGQKLNREIGQRIAIALQIPNEYLRSAVIGKRFADEFPSNKICPSCWRPGNAIDERWAMADVKFCFFCGEKMIAQCPRCKEEIHLSAKFCPECGLSYKDIVS